MINLKKIPSTGFTRIDDEHKVLADLFNDIYSLVNTTKKDEKRFQLPCPKLSHM